VNRRKLCMILRKGRQVNQNGIVLGEGVDLIEGHLGPHQSNLMFY